MTNEALPGTTHEPPTLPVETYVEIVLPDGFTRYILPEVDVVTDPSESTKARTDRAVATLESLYNSAVPQYHDELVNDTPYSPSEIVARDERGGLALLRPASNDGQGRVTYEPSTDKNGKPRRPLMAPPSASNQPQPTKESMKTDKHMFHAAEQRNNHLLSARRKILATEHLITPGRLGIKNNELSVRQFDPEGKRTIPDPDNPGLRSFGDLSYREKMSLFMSSNPPKFERKVAQKALRIFNTSIAKGDRYQTIVSNHGHDTEPQLLKPRTWVKRDNGRRGSAAHPPAGAVQIGDASDVHIEPGRVQRSVEATGHAASKVGRSSLKAAKFVFKPVIKPARAFREAITDFRTDNLSNKAALNRIEASLHDKGKAADGTDLPASVNNAELRDQKLKKANELMDKVIEKRTKTLLRRAKHTR